MLALWGLAGSESEQQGLELVEEAWREWYQSSRMTSILKLSMDRRVTEWKAGSIHQNFGEYMRKMISTSAQTSAIMSTPHRRDS